MQPLPAARVPHRPPLHDPRQRGKSGRGRVPASGGIRPAVDKPSVDTRSKIVTAGQVPPAATLVTGYFDVLRVEHVRALQQVRDRTGDHPLVVAVLPRQRELFHQRARAEMVAALRMVDYVLIANRAGLDGIL